MPAPTLSTDGTTYTATLTPFRRYGYALVSADGEEWDGAAIYVRQATADDHIELAEHTENGGNEILATTNSLDFVLIGTPNGPIEIRIGEITGK